VYDQQAGTPQLRNMARFPVMDFRVSILHRALGADAIPATQCSSLVEGKLNVGATGAHSH
jgi:hypothetical protein